MSEVWTRLTGTDLNSGAVCELGKAALLWLSFLIYKMKMKMIIPSLQGGV